MLPTVDLLDVATGQTVSAALLPSLTTAEMDAAEADWAPHRAALFGVEHAHWDWGRKARWMADHDGWCLGLWWDGRMQGMILLTAESLGRLPPDAGRPLAYVEFVESAPWNIAVPGRPPVYRGVGLRLMEAAVCSSRDRGFAGRIALHSLTQSAGFYVVKCGMTSTGWDAEYDMEYLEHTAESADRFLAGE